ncbi:diguanylate cyclase [Nautilia sp. PV-1]|uniref:GGDEF domain-containing protein n=1 Tax=Nautilia sp. PV-1 TaxID=2579250 RepID=UPI000FDC0E73|nr:diguanylate cyclase [Nautilia sp. PV-1]AZV47393.1 diguanylate cyclase [Nautilia sp. PV-1]
MISKKDDKFSTVEVAGLNEPSSPLEEFAKKVFDKMIEENVPPIPYYYKMYFLNMLDEEPESFRNQVYEYITLEETNELEKDLEIEKKLKQSFKYSKELLQHTAVLYKNSQAIKDIFEKYKSETAHIANPKLFERLINGFEERLKKINEKLDNELNHIKQLYSKNVEILKDIESNSIFDARYGIYNKNFFIRELKKEIKLIEKFKHKSSVVVLKVKDSVFASLKSEKSKILLNRSVAKIMLKTSRRTDIIAHLGDGVFAMLLKHTDRIGACKTVERLSDIISNSAIFLEGEEINIKIVAGIVEILSNEDVEVLVSHALMMMEKAQEDDVLYYIYEGN